MKNFKFINNNPQGVLTEDCVIRSISLFLNIPYEQVLNNLLDIYRLTGYHIGDKRCYEEYLKSYNIKIINISNYNITISELITFISNNYYGSVPELSDIKSDKLLILLQNFHLTYMEKYVIMDTWNCICEKISQIYVQGD